MSGFCMDEAGQFDDVSSVQDKEAAIAATSTTAAQPAKLFRHNNYGFLQRWRHQFDDAKNTTKVVPYYFPVTSCDFLQSKRAFPSGFDLHLRFMREKDGFLLLTSETNANKFKVAIKKIRLYVRYIDIHPLVLEEHRKKLASNLPIIYPFHKTLMRSKEFGAGQTVSWPSVFTGTLPKQIVIALIEANAYLGKASKNPWHFQNFNINSLYVKHNGKQYPDEIFEPDFANNLYMREYGWFFDNCGIHFQGK